MDMVAPARKSVTKIDAQPSMVRFGAIACVAALGLLPCSIANAFSRQTQSPSQLIYWAGILLIAVPTSYRLTSRDAPIAESLALVCMLGLSLYGVKLVRDAPIYTFSDEIIHAFSSNE